VAAVLAATSALAQAPGAAAAPPAAPTAAEHINKAATEAGAELTESGMVYRVLKEGTGARPGSPTDTVRVHYRGTFPDGREFDSSHKRGQPAMFRLNRVIKCWTEGVQKMKVGGRAKLTCPPELAYGERNVGDGLIPPGSTLVFEVELLGVLPTP
jgi:FKBP-type peptidyl-prolyl cis-trans isomerase FkpA